MRYAYIACSGSRGLCNKISASLVTGKNAARSLLIDYHVFHAIARRIEYELAQSPESQSIIRNLGAIRHRRPVLSSPYPAYR